MCALATKEEEKGMMVPRSKRFQRPPILPQQMRHFSVKDRGGEGRRRRRDSGQADRSADKHAGLADSGLETGVTSFLSFFKLGVLN